jgi:hypothetical protein
MTQQTTGQQFTTRDSSTAHFWDERFIQAHTPWDRGDVPAALRQFAAAAAQPLCTLIPGCGAAHEVAFLSEAGWDVTAIDFSPAAVAEARQKLGSWATRVQQADFFDYAPQQPLDMIYERAFLCALPRRMWGDVAARWAALLPQGALLGGFFYFDDNEKGPPFGIAPERLDALMQPYFERIEDFSVVDSIPVFVGKERWQIWRRLS